MGAHRGVHGAPRRITKPVLRGNVVNNGTPNGLTTTVTVPAWAGDTLVVFAVAYAELPTIVDGNGNPLNTVITSATTGNVQMRVATATASAGNNAITAQRAVDGDAVYVQAFALTGPATVQAATTASATSGTALGLPSVSTIYNDGWVFAAWGIVAFDGVVNLTAPANYTVGGTTPANAQWSMTLLERTSATPLTTGTVTPTPSKTTSAGWAGAMIAISKPPKTLEVGVVGGTFLPDIPRACGRPGMGAPVMRAEFAVTDNLTTVVDPVVAACATYKIKLQPLIGWANGVTAPDLTPLAAWASRYGKGGTFWGGGDDTYAITDIELGNENSYAYKSGTQGSTGYNSLATSYGQRALAAAQAINTANPNVKVLVELEEGYPFNVSYAWIDNVLTAGGATLISLMRGPVIHPYGPTWQDRITRNYNYLVSKGLSKPYYCTEFNIPSDDGATLSDSGGWATNLTYTQAANLLSGVFAGMAALPTMIKQVLLYQIRDLRAHGVDNDKEHYFGITNNVGDDKGAISSLARTLFVNYP